MVNLKIWKRKKNTFKISENYEYDFTNSDNYVKSTLKTYPLMVTLYIYILLGIGVIFRKMFKLFLIFRLATFVVMLV